MAGGALQQLLVHSGSANQRGAIPSCDHRDCSTQPSFEGAGGHFVPRQLAGLE